MLFIELYSSHLKMNIRQSWQLISGQPIVLNKKKSFQIESDF